MPTSSNKEPHSPETMTNDYVRSRLTVLFITSPHVIIPGTRMLEEVALSLTLARGVPRNIPKIIIADGFKMGNTYAWKKGRVNTEYAQRYHIYLHRLHALTQTAGSWLEGAKLVCLQQRHGFAHALRRGLERARTRYVLVAQHDRSIMRPVCVATLLRTMETHVHVKHVGLLTGALARYEENIVQQRYPQCLESVREGRIAVQVPPDLRHFQPGGDSPPRAESPANQDATPVSTSSSPPHNSKLFPINSSMQSPLHAPRLTPLIQFSDSMHIACRDHYLRNVYGINRKVKLHIGDFLEDTYGQHQVKDIRTRGMSAHAFYGTYFFEDGNPVAMVGHLDGHDPRAADENFPKYGWSSEHVKEESWVDVGLDTSALRSFDDLPFGVDRVFGFHDQ